MESVGFEPRTFGSAIEKWQIALIIAQIHQLKWIWWIPDDW